MSKQPAIAILCPNALMGIGLKSILEKIIPHFEVTIFDRFEVLLESSPERYVHYFVSSRIAIEQSGFFQTHRAKSILLIDGTPHASFGGFNALNILQSEEGLMRDLLRLYHHAHQGGHPHMGEGGGSGPTGHPSPHHRTPLTEREVEVLSLLARGMINKQIADALGISLTTVITHRRNIMRKLKTRSLSALTIYAVAHGLIDPNF